ncbi:MAG: phosphatidylserine decarboxylase [Caldilineaceae bacterium]
MSFASEQLAFFRQFLADFSVTGSVAPSSAALAAALSRECAQQRGPKRVLEVGAGTGAVTAELVKHIQPGDQLVVCEINPTFATYLRKRFGRESAFQAAAGQTRVYEGSILDLPTEQKFDFIISSLPFNAFPPEFVAAVFAHYQALLKPGGVLSYYEYIGGRTLKQLFATSETSQRLLTILDQQRRAYAFRRDQVVGNLPPAWVHYLRFTEAPQPQTAPLAPPADRERLALGPVGIDTDGIPFVLGLVGVATLLRKRWPQQKFWWLPALTAPLVALFFRDPERRTIYNPNLVYAASDGKVLAVERLRDERFGDTEWLRIVVFLSILDVHVNRAPITGQVVEIVHEEGGFASANTRAAEHNMAQYTVIEGTHGRCIVAQRAGLIARRIVNRSKLAGQLAQGEKFGLIRFGSRTDVYLPANKARALVKKGDTVRGGETILARFVA